MATNRGGLVIGNIPNAAGRLLDGSITLDPSPVIMMRDFMAIGDSMQDFSVPLERAIREVIMPSIDQNFQSQGRPNTWQALSESTMQLRESRGINSNRIMEVSGNLRQTATSFDIWTVNRDSAYIADLPADVWYGVMQQNGLSAIHLPARPFMMIQESDEDAIEQVFVDWVADVFADNGFEKG